MSMFRQLDMELRQSHWSLQIQPRIDFQQLSIEIHGFKLAEIELLLSRMSRLTTYFTTLLESCL